MGNVKLLKINRRESPFVQMDKKNISFNKNLTFKAKGILSVLLGLDPNQDFNLGELKLYSCDGEASTETGIKELKEKGFLEVFRWREPNGLFGWGFTVHEIPLEIPVSRYRIIDNPNNTTEEVQASKVAEIATKYNIDESIVLSILNEQQPIVAPIQPKKEQEDFKTKITTDSDFKTLCVSTYNLTPSVYEELLTRFFTQKSVLTGKTYTDYEALKTHVFNWLRVHLSKNKPVQQAAKNSHNTSPQYSKEKVNFEIAYYKNMCDSVNEKSTYKQYKDATANLLCWLGVAEKNGYMVDDEKIQRFRELEKRYNTAGELRVLFDETIEKNKSGSTDKPNEKNMKAINEQLKGMFKNG